MKYIIFLWLNHQVFILFPQVELGQLQAQIENRKERLTSLILQRQELDQISGRLIAWYEDKQRLISSDQTIPLKITEVERIQKKYSV